MRCEGWQGVMLEREGLDPAQARELDQHLSTCPACREWAEALTEVDSNLTARLQAEVKSPELSRQISLAVQRERSWAIRAPEFLEALGWYALGVVLMAGVLLGFKWRGWQLWLVAASTLAGSLAWAARYL